MAEEEELMDLANSTSHTTIELEKLLKEDNLIFLITIGVGLLAHLLIIYTTVKSKRLRSRTNIIIMNWMIFEMLAYNIIYPIMHYVRIHEYSFMLHMITGNLVLLSILTSLMLLNVLLTESVMMSDKTSFKEFLERFYAILLTCHAIVLFWKLFVEYDVYVELLLIFAYLVSFLVLVIRVLYRQCHRVVKCKVLNTNEELRMHLTTFFIVAKMVVSMLGVFSVVYKNAVMMHLSKFWCLSGIYVIVLLIVKDINFKISLYEVLGLNVKNPNDVDTMITEDGDDSLVETCIEN